jgi:HlyD family secretion protein
MHKNKRIIIIPIVLVVIAIAAGVWYFVKWRNAQSNNLIRASGTIETVEFLIASERAGRVAEVMVQKGDQVEAGDPLFRLDDDLLQSQRQQALAALDSARANLLTAQTGLESA